MEPAIEHQAQPSISPEMRQRYLERRKADQRELTSALAQKNADVFKKVGHQVKGNAATFGYTDLEGIAKRLEAAGEAKNFDDAKDALEAFDLWIKNQPAA